MSDLTIDLLQKYTLSINNNKDDCIFNIEFTEDLSGIIYERDLYNTLNKYKSLIDEIENQKIWDFCKKLSNECELLHQCIRNKNSNIGVANYDPISRAFFKMWEICKDFDLINDSDNQITYGALAEGPGGFIECFNYYRRKYCSSAKDIINCITLKSNSNEVPGWTKSQRIIKECDNCIVSYGEDGTGDLYKSKNIKNFAKLFDFKKADLVTGDGGFDFSGDYNNQETTAFQLIFCEVVAGLAILDDGGHMVIKVFDLFQSANVDLLYILSYYFNEVYITKPYSSRSANSEKYIVCKDFRGISNLDIDTLLEMVDDIAILAEQKKYVTRLLSNEIPKEFLDMVHSANIYYTGKQIQSLLKGVSFFYEHLDNNDITTIKKEQTIYGLSWCKKYDFPINYRCRYLKDEQQYNFIPNY